MQQKTYHTRGKQEYFDKRMISVRPKDSAACVHGDSGRSCATKGRSRASQVKRDFGSPRRAFIGLSERREHAIARARVALPDSLPG
jgi:hypothetical protein